MRLGAMKRPFYRLVVVDSRNRRDGRYIENLGTYNPIPKAAEVKLKDDRILHWLGEGVQLSGTAESLIRDAGLLEKYRLIKAGASPEELDDKLAEWKAKQPQAAGDKLSRAEKKAKKKEDARDAEASAKAEAAVAEAAPSEGDAEAPAEEAGETAAEESTEA